MKEYKPEAERSDTSCSLLSPPAIIAICLFILILTLCAFPQKRCKVTKFFLHTQARAHFSLFLCFKDYFSRLYLYRSSAMYIILSYTYPILIQNANTALLFVNLLPSFPAARADPLWIPDAPSSCEAYRSPSLARNVYTDAAASGR